jgi:2'-5' RNA ligase
MVTFPSGRSEAETSKRVVVAFPRVEDDGAWREVLAVRQRYDPLAGRIGAHLTLVSPFEDALSDAALERHLRAAVGTSPRFAVLFRGITAHEGEYLFLNVKVGNDAIVELHERLYGDLLAGHRRRSHTFVPHVTVGRVSREELPAALDATAGLTGPIRASVEAISVYRIDPDGTRPILFEVPLAAP